MNVEQLVENKIKSLIETANKLYQRNFEMPTIKYTLNGRVSGKAYHIANVVDFNKILLTENVDTFIHQTVPHEIAHIIAFKVFGTSGHDRAWKHVMARFGVEPKRCHSYSIENVKKRHVTTFVYKCQCREHTITSIRHNKILKGASYRCNQCKTKIVLK